MGGRPRSFDEGEVLDRAMEIFWRDGYAATSMQALLAHMGISRQSLYNAFGDKHRLFLAALDRYIEQRAVKQLASLEAQGAGFRAVVEFFQRIGEAAEVSGPARRCCMVGKTCMELRSEDPDVQKRVQRHFERMVSAFEGALGNAVASGEIEPLDTAAVARHLTATVNGLGIMFKGGLSHKALADVVQVALSVIRPIRPENRGEN